MTDKRCYRCKQTRPVVDFAKNRATKDGLQAACRTCSRNIRLESQERHAEAIRLRHLEKLARTPTGGATKSCKACGAVKPMLEFYAHRSTADGRANNCMSCAKLIQREWNAKNRDKIRQANARRDADPAKRQRYRRNSKAWRLRLYGLTPEGFDRLLADQGGCCAVCGEPGQTWAERNLHVDHDHNTGEVRGLLCGRCNVGLGFFKDNAELLNKALDYLKSPPASNSREWEAS
jgi:hypothetical protein